jgi:hypothetical protein
MLGGTDTTDRNYVMTENTKQKIPLNINSTFANVLHLSNSY